VAVPGEGTRFLCRSGSNDAVQFLDSPKKTVDADGGVAEPAERPAVGAYRRKAG
jgi:hypothetical protein